MKDEIGDDRLGFGVKFEIRIAKDELQRTKD